MSDEAINWFVEEQSAEVIRRYQNGGNFMAGTHRKVKSIDGKSLTLRNIGKLKVRPLVRKGKAAPQNAEMGTITLETQASQIFYLLSEDDTEQMTPEDKDSLSQESADAFGREKDRICYTALDQGAGQYGTIIGDGNQPLTADMALEACDAMQDKDVPWDGNVFCPLPSRQWNNLLTHKAFIEADYVGPDLPFAKKMTKKTWNGVHWMMAYNDLFPRLGMPKRVKGTLNAKDRFYMYHYSALASGDVYDIRSNTVWDNDRTAYTVNSRMRMGAEVLDKEGVVEFLVKGNAPLAFA